MAVINSEVFTVWKSHFERLLEIMKDWNDAHVYTVLRSIHQSFSDFPIISPRFLQKSGTDKLMRTIGTLAIALLDGRVDQCLSKFTIRKMEIEMTAAKFRSPSKKRLIGELGDIIVH